MSKFLQYRDGGKTDEKGISQHLAGLFKGEVINGLAVTQDSPLGMSVLVSKGRCMIDSGSDYPYLGFTDANEVVTITTADGSNPRIDAIVAYVDLSVVDSTNPNNPGAFEIVAVAGTPAGSPSAPNSGAISSAIGSGNPFIRLANVTVGTGVTTITTGNVSDQRVMANVADGLVGTDTLGQGVVTADKLAPTTWAGFMSALNPITTSYTNIASVTLPAVTSAHKYLIVASFYLNHNAGASARDYTGAIRNGTTLLVQTSWSALPNEYINTISVNTVFTSSSSGGETINFSVARNADNGGFVVASRGQYSIVDLGLA